MRDGKTHQSDSAVHRRIDPDPVYIRLSKFSEHYQILSTFIPYSD